MNRWWIHRKGRRNKPLSERSMRWLKASRLSGAAADHRRLIGDPLHNTRKEI